MDDTAPDMGKTEAGLEGSVFALSVGKSEGPKSETEWARFRIGIGVEEDDVPEQWQLQVGLLSRESLEKAREEGKHFCPGYCGDNICTQSVNLDHATVGCIVEVGKAVLLVTQKGKICHRECSGVDVGEPPCALSREWVYARVIKGGQVTVGDAVHLLRPGVDPVPRKNRLAALRS
jgi:MOSC domain-containing protein YiiM